MAAPTIQPTINSPCETAAKQEPIPSKSASSKNFLINLVILLCLGVAFCGWVLAYTDWFPIVGGLLSLGGIFSWLAFVSRMLPDEIIKEMQSGFVERLSKPYIRVLLITAATLLLLASTCFGAIRVQALPSSQITGFDLYREGSDDIEPYALDTDGSLNVLVPTLWWQPSNWRIKVQGYPYEPVSIRPFQRPRKYLPETQHPHRVLLIVPNEDFLRIHSAGSVKLLIDVDDRHLVIDKYDGFAFWIGCSADVKVPQITQAELRMNFPKGTYSALDATLDVPRSDQAWLGPNKKQLDLEFSMKKIVLTVVDAKGKKHPKRPIELQERGESFVQVEYLED